MQYYYLDALIECFCLNEFNSSLALNKVQETLINYDNEYCLLYIYYYSGCHRISKNIFKTIDCIIFCSIKK